MTHEIHEQLETLAQMEGSNVYTDLKKGDEIRMNYQSYTAGYLMDQPNFFRRTIRDGQDIFNATLDAYLAFKNDSAQRLRMIKELGCPTPRGKLVPYSEFFNRGIGLCAEKSILFQLMVQDSLPSFLIFGTTQDKNMFHAYNVFFHENNPLLVDVQNPIKLAKISENNTISNTDTVSEQSTNPKEEITPFIAQVLSLETDEFQIDEYSRKLGLRYFLV